VAATFHSAVCLAFVVAGRQTRSFVTVVVVAAYKLISFLYNTAVLYQC